MAQGMWGQMIPFTIPFTDNDLVQLKEYMADKRAIVYGSLAYSKITDLISRLEASEEIANGFEAAHPEDENCGCSMCDLLKVWRKAAGK